MADDLSNRGPADRARIDVNQEHEVRYWTKKFGCTSTELRNAVQAVGVMADKVEDVPQETKTLKPLPPELEPFLTRVVWILDLQPR
ncbi:MAG: DUF3606 domain-containing protein [Betaproteobacteria bacterium]|nr:MAG: DUF3606 domain-containing protein [Betaproteobacteria bacterium]